jgi:hypothetical protein
MAWPFLVCKVWYLLVVTEKCYSYLTLTMPLLCCTTNTVVYPNTVKSRTCLELADHGPPESSAAFPLLLSLSPDHVSPSGLSIIKTFYKRYGIIINSMNHFLGQKMSENSHKICKHVNMELYIICQLSSNRKVMIHISRFYFLFCVRIKLNQMGILLKNLKKHKSSMLTHYCITL